MSLGLQKNFERFMETFREVDGQSPPPLPDVPAYKAMIAQVILFKKVTSLVRPRFPAFQANVANYLVSLCAVRLGDRISLDKIWTRQSISDALRQQLEIWADEVHGVLHRTSGGKMISEWAKKSECWDLVRAAKYSPPRDDIPEMR